MKKMKLIPIVALLLILMLTLAACGTNLAAELQQDQAAADAAPTEIDPVAIFTAAAATVNAQMTQTAMAWSPTPLPATNTPLPQPTATLIQLDAVTATLNPAVPTFTPLAGVGIPTATQAVISTQEGPVCDSMTYDISTLDQTYADGTEVPAGTNFEKIWRIYNNGTCTWDDGYELVYYSSVSSRGDSNPLDAAPVAFAIKNNVQPGEAVDVSAKLTAPLDNGDYTAYFVMRNDRGDFFGGFLSVVIKVTDGK